MKIPRPNRIKVHCIHGHKQGPNSRNTNGGCKACYKNAQSAYNAKFYEKHKEQELARAANRRHENPEKCSAANAAWKERNPEQVRELARQQNRKRNLNSYGWSLEMWEGALKEQKNCCAVCRFPFTEGNGPCADHEHTVPPKPRGILHRSCNSALGMLKDSVEICESAVEYLRKWKEAQNA
jgi:hypothetical protein